MKPPERAVRNRTISIKPENHRKKDEEGDSNPLHKEASDFSQEQMEKVWTYYTESIAQQYPNFYSILNTRNGALKEEFLVEITLDNRAQEMTFNERKADLLEFLRQELRNQMIQFSVKVEQSENELRPYTADEKFKAMAEKNPLVKQLKEKLDLELEL